MLFVPGVAQTEDDGLYLTSSAWSPAGDVVLLSGAQAVSLHLATLTCTPLPVLEELEELPLSHRDSRCLAWSPEGTALIMHYGFNDDDDEIYAFSIWSPSAAKYIASMPVAAIEPLVGPIFGGHPTAIFLQGAVYIGVAEHNAIVEWDYRAGQHRLLGLSTVSLGSPGIFYFNARGQDVIWQSGQGMCVTHLGAPISRIENLSVPTQWHCLTDSDIYCTVVRREPHLVLAFWSGPHKLEVSCDVNIDEACLTDELHPYWVGNASAFVVPLQRQLYGDDKTLLRIAFRDF